MRSWGCICCALSLQAMAGQAPQQASPGHVDALASGGGAARSNLGAALAETGQYDAAIQEDAGALEAAPGNTALRMNLALAYYKKGDMAHAHVEFEKVHVAQPADVKAAILLAYTDMKVDRVADAAALLTPLEPGHESDMDFEHVLGYALIETGKNSRSEE